MSDVFVVRNQLGHYWGKGKLWVDGTDRKAIMRTKHEDDAVNTLFELSSKDIELRGEVLAASLSEKGEPDVAPSEHLLPKECDKEAAAESVADAEPDVPLAADETPASTADTSAQPAEAIASEDAASLAESDRS